MATTVSGEPLSAARQRSASAERDRICQWVIHPGGLLSSAGCHGNVLGGTKRWFCRTYPRPTKRTAMRLAHKLEKPAPALVRVPDRSQRRLFQLMWNANAYSKSVMPVSAFVHWYQLCRPRV